VVGRSGSAFDMGASVDLMAVPRFLGRGGWTSRALIASPLPLKVKSRLPKRIVVPGGQLSSRLAIWSFG
jgi:hypothetical protein